MPKNSIEVVDFEQAREIIGDETFRGTIITELLAERLGNNALNCIELTMADRFDVDRSVEDRLRRLTFPLDSTWDQLYRPYSKKQTSEPRELHAIFEVEDEEIQAHYKMPYTALGQKNIAIEGLIVYSPKIIERKKSSSRQLGRSTVVTPKPNPNPLYGPENNGFIHSFNGSSAIGIMKGAKRSGRLGTV